MSDQVILWIIFVIIFIVNTAIPAIVAAGALGRLKRNPWLGIRTSSTMRSDEAWRTGHAGGMRWAMITSAFTIVPSAIALVLGLMGTPSSMHYVMVVVVIISSIPLILMTRQANRSAKSTL